MLRGPYSEAEHGLTVLAFTVLRCLERVMAPHRDAMAEVDRAERSTRGSSGGVRT